MVEQARPQVIAIEEHFWDRDLVKHFTGGDVIRGAEIEKRLYDLGELRIREMDEAGIDIQVLSHGAPGGQKLPDDIALAASRAVNDRLHAAIRQHPTRFAGFAMVPTNNAAEGADELERCVTKLGFKGAM